MIDKDVQNVFVTVINYISIKITFLQKIFQSQFLLNFDIFLQTEEELNVSVKRA